MDEQELKQGFVELDKLAEIEYHQSINELLNDNPERTADRLGRLIGVTLKEPFAVSQQLAAPSPRSGAYRAWDLVRDEGAFEAHASTWQYQVLTQIRADSAFEDGMTFSSNYQLAFYCHNEFGFWGRFARVLQGYICGDPKIRAEVASAFKDAGIKAGDKITPERVVAVGGLGLGVYLVDAIPLLGFAAAPMIAGLLLIIYKLGVHAFCERTNEMYTADSERV